MVAMIGSSSSSSFAFAFETSWRLHQRQQHRSNENRQLPILLRRHTKQEQTEKQMIINKAFSSTTTTSSKRTFRRVRFSSRKNRMVLTMTNDPDSSNCATGDSTSTKQIKQIVVVGAGVGGLATASRMAYDLSLHKTMKAKIVVLEKNAKQLSTFQKETSSTSSGSVTTTTNMIGGRCGSTFVHTKEDGRIYRHERGPSLLLLPDTYRELFQYCNTTMEDHGLTIKQCLPACQVVFDDGDTIDLGFPQHAFNTTAHQRSRQTMDMFEPSGSKNWDTYMEVTNAFLNCGLPNFIEERFDLKSFPSFLWQALRDGGKFWPLKPHSDVLDATFDSLKMKALASFQNLYVGLEPYRNNKEAMGGGILKHSAPSVFGLLSALELHPTNPRSGVFAPIGGFEAVSNALESLANSLGVEIFYDKVVTNVQDDGVYYIDKQDNSNISTTQFLPSDLTIINADIPYAKQTLLQQHTKLTNNQDHDRQIQNDKQNYHQIYYDWDDTVDFSSGVIAFHWSLKETLSDLRTHNVFLVASNSNDAKQSWRSVRDPRNDSSNMNIEPFNFYVHRPTVTDSSAAPFDGGDVLMVLVPCPSLLRINPGPGISTTKEKMMEFYKAQFTKEYVDRVRSAVLQRLSILPSLATLQELIVHEFVDTPVTYANLYNVGAGVPFGMSHGLSQLSIMRPSAEVKDLNNVLMVGASGRPGNGVPLVLIGAKLVAQKAIQKLLK